MDGDAGLILPGAYTIQGGVEVPCGPFVMPMGYTCTNMTWGGNVDIDVTNASGADVYVNVLMDWDGDGKWGGSSICPGGPTDEHVLVDFRVPAGYAGSLSALGPPSFLSGPNVGYFWTRFSVTDVPVMQDWDGSGVFELGETEDYLLLLVEDVTFDGEYGDAPEGALAYPASGINGAFPTCYGSGPAGYVIHALADGYPAMFGSSLDWEPEGNAGNCPNFPPYDADECFSDGDAGLLMPPAYTIQAGSVVPCTAQTGSLGSTCQAGVWGGNIDIWVDNSAGALADAYVNVLFDWNHDGQWQGRQQCPAGAAPEHVLWNFQVPRGYAGPLSGLNPPAFLIGPQGGYVWARFTIAYMQIPFDWDGHWVFHSGESEDYLLHVEGDEEEYGEYGDAPENSLAYPSLGIFGSFPTCAASGPAGFVYHQPIGWAYFGQMLDFEIEGNAGNCPNFPPYDADECFNDPDAGLLFPPAYTIDTALNVVPCDPTLTGPLGNACTAAIWGGNVDIHVTNNMPVDGFVNVLMDWNQDGKWQGSSQCPTAAAPEHVLVNFPVPMGFSGPLSVLNPPSFLIGPNAGYVWSRFTVSESSVVTDWDGSGWFEDGETCDYLLEVVKDTDGDYGDAPEGATAYPYLGIAGQFPTCLTTGPAGYVQHAPVGGMYLGGFVDFETDGNAGSCLFPPYDSDECGGAMALDGGLMIAMPFTIDAAMSIVPCPGVAPGCFAYICDNAVWGMHVDLSVTNTTNVDVYLNVLMDWDQSGWWQGSSMCPNGPAAEHVLVDFVIPAGFSGLLSALGPPSFLTGPYTGYVWTRFTVSDAPVGIDWDGSGYFSDGESEDYLLCITEREAEYGDAPEGEGAFAYPELGVFGAFPTCVGSGPAGYVVHAVFGGVFFGPMVDFETEGNAGNCPNFPPYDADECFVDADAGLLIPPAATIDAALNYVPCMPPAIEPLGYACSTAVWGGNVDIHVENTSSIDVFVNVLMDWNRDGQWSGSSDCEDGPAPEHVLVDFVVPAGFSGPISGLAPPSFVIGPDTSYVWTRFTIGEHAVGIDWNGEATFEIGETEDYLLYVAESEPSDVGDAGAPIRATRILACRPSPFSRTTTVFFQVDRPQEVTVSICDVNGRHVRTLVAGGVDAGRYDATWYGKTDAGRPVAAGVYFLRLQAGKVRESRPIILLR